MLLGAVKGEFVAWEQGVDLAGDVALEAAHRFLFGLAVLDPSFDVVAGSGVIDHAGQHDAPQRGVGVPVAATVEAVALLFAGAGIDR
jgi:hypothetical protein